MQCQLCNKKTATIHLTEITGSSRTEMHVCEACAIQQGIASKSQMSVNELLSNLLAAQPSDEEMFGTSDTQTTCPDCGMTMAQFRKEGVLGCPHDYGVFEDALLPLIEHAHNGKTRHAGKVPAHVPARTRSQMELSQLREQLQGAVHREEYELAAELRDKIQHLEKPDRI